MTRKWKTNQTTSKIYKPYINGKPKRPETHQYPYLGPKVAVVAGKLDPTVDRICFLSYLSNGDESGEKDPGNEFRGSKNGGKEVLVGLKLPENTKIRRPKLAAAAAFAGPIQARPAAAGRKFYRRGRLVVLLLPVRRVYSNGGRNWLPRLKPDRPKNGSRRPNSGFSGFWDFLSGFGVGSSLGTQN